MPRADQLKLHEGMIVAMVRKRRYRVEAETLARWVSELELFRRWKDDEHAPGWQIVRRANRYPEFFVVESVGGKTYVVLRFHFPELGWGTKRPSSNIGL
jgi:hypothetical protein